MIDTDAFLRMQKQSCVCILAVRGRPQTYFVIAGSNYTLTFWQSSANVASRSSAKRLLVDIPHLILAVIRKMCLAAIRRSWISLAMSERIAECYSSRTFNYFKKFKNFKVQRGRVRA